MTLMSGALDKSVFDGDTIFVKISEGCGRHRYTYIDGDIVCSFLTHDDFHNYISNMVNNLVPDSVGIGEENIFLSLHILGFINGIGLMIVSY